MYYKAESDDDPEFWKILGGKGPIASADAGGMYKMTSFMLHLFKYFYFRL